MSKIIISSIVIIIFLGIFFPFLPIEAYENPITSQYFVDNDYNNATTGFGFDHFNSIQDAINNASDGDTIYVHNGTYYENLAINRSINLIGENMSNTIIHSGEFEYESGPGLDSDYIGKEIVTILSDNVNISGFTIQNNTMTSGIIIRSNFNNISGNIIKNNVYGIYLLSSSNNSIVQNNITKNQGRGIYLRQSSQNYIAENMLYNNFYDNLVIDLSSDNMITQNTITLSSTGLDIYGGSNNIITENIISNNFHYGIYIRSTTYADPSINLSAEIMSYNNTITRNTIKNSSTGIFLTGDSSDNLIYNNNFINNSNMNANDSANNNWDNGYEGNYWDDYMGVDEDKDGIGDNPYNIAGDNNKDNYPLMIMYESALEPIIHEENEDNQIIGLIIILSLLTIVIIALIIFRK